MDELSLGAVLAILEATDRLRVSAANSKRFLLIMLGAGAVALVLFFKFSGANSPIINIVKFSILATSYLGLMGIVITSAPQAWYNRLLQTKPFIFTGKISYGLYVYHPLCFEVMNYYFKLPLIANFIASFALSYAISSLSYYAFEEPFLKLKKYFN